MAASVADWSKLLSDAVEKPGVIAEAYRRFWNYSTGNQLLALFQCFARGIEPGPINTFVGWRQCGRHVKKGEKAITLCMPVTRMVEKSPEPPDKEGGEATKVAVVRFIHRAHWFVLSQTEGADFVPPPPPPDWSEERALGTLGIRKIPFDCLNGNVQGYARERTVSVSPIAFDPHRTLFHEIAHVALGHTTEGDRLIDDESTPRSLREVEAESVAMLCAASLGLPGIEFSRGYIQNWLRIDAIPDRSAQRIFKTADLILRAGYPANLKQGDQPCPDGSTSNGFANP